MITPRLRGLIDGAAFSVALPPWDHQGETFAPGVWLEGLILGESRGDSHARRYEAHQDRAVDPDIAGVDDQEHEDDASYGLMQVMGYNARRLVGAADSVPLNFSFLYRPMLNMSLGLTILTGELATVTRLHPNTSDAEKIERALCRYNGGPTGDTLVSGDYRLRRYVEHIATNVRAAQENRRTV